VGVRISLLLSLLAAAPLAGCPEAAKDTKYPPRAEGCEVQMFHDTPSVMSDNIGPVTATCGADVKDDDCMRTLKDQACKLGADILWGVSDIPSNVQGKKQFAGRAAHTKTAGK
jgi:hypothetical protein